MSNTETERAKALRNIGPSSIVTVDNVPAEDVVSLKVYVDPVQDLHGYDHPWPAGGGKNKLKNNGNSGSSGGITWVMNDDGSVTLSGTAGESYVHIYFNGTKSLQLLGSGAISLVCSATANYNPNINGINFQNDIYADGTYKGTIQRGQVKNSYSGTAIEVGTSRLRIAPGTVIPNGTKFYPAIEVGDAISSAWSPYSNICPISGWTGANVSATGVNVWDEEWEVGGYSTATGEKGVDPSRIRCKNMIPCKPNTTFYNHSPQTIIFLFYDCAGTYLSYYGVVSNHDFTTPQNACYITFYVASAYGTTYNHDISINYPSTATSYEPFGSTYSVTFPTEAGTVYGGTLDVTKGKLTVDKQFLTFNGTESWSKSNISPGSTALGLIRLFTSLVEYPVAKLNSETLSSQLPTYTGPSWNVNVQSSLRVEINDTNRRYEVAVFTSNFADANAWRTYLRSNPIEVVYELDTPITYQLTPTQITLLAGVNNVWADCGDILKMRYWSYDLLLNKVVYDNNTLIDLTGDTITPEVMLAGYTAHDATGSEIEGNIEIATMAEVQTYFGLS